jgi:hypothetical protein
MNLLFERLEVLRFLFEYRVGRTQRGKVGMQDARANAARGPNHLTQIFLVLVLLLPSYHESYEREGAIRTLYSLEALKH